MIVIATKTETRLLQDLRHCLKETPAQRCFHMRFSQTAIVKKDLFETFLKLLEDLPNAYMAQVYLCKDKDIFILLQGFMQRQFMEFVQKLSAALAIENCDSLVEVFEVGIHWNKLEGLCQQKIYSANTEQETQEEERKLKTEKTTLSILEKLDITLIDNLAKRRADRKHANILIVDDDQLCRTLVGNVLRHDFEVHFAKNGAEALKEYLLCTPDVLFLDIGLPDINGHEILECLFQIDPDAYVIMLSGRKDKENIVRALETGAQGFIGKPFTRNKLFEYIQKSPFVAMKKNMDEKPQRTAP